MANITYRTVDHPEANGRQPNEGENEWQLFFPLEDGSTLYVRMGDEGFNAVKQVICDAIIDEYAEKIPKEERDLGG